MRAKPLAWWFCFSAPHMWTGLVEVSPTSFPNSETADHSSVGRGITIAETPKVESSRKPRDGLWWRPFSWDRKPSSNYCEGYIHFSHHLLLAKTVLWRCDSLHPCAFQELFLLRNAETGSLPMSRNVARKRKCCQNKNCSGMPHSRFPFVEKKKHMYSSVRIHFSHFL